MKYLMIALLFLTGGVFAQTVNGYFGILQCEDLYVDSLCHIESDSVIVTSIWADWMSCLDDMHIWGVCYVDSTIVGTNAETIDNETNGYWNFGGAILAYSYNYATAAMVAGTGDATTIDFTPDFPALAAGARITYLAEAANTGAMTLAIDGGAAKAVIESADGSALEANDIRSGSIVDLVYDGTAWQQVSQSGN